jgi:hypothetical protein
MTARCSFSHIDQTFPSKLMKKQRSTSGMCFNDSNDSDNLPLLSKEGKARSVSPTGRNINNCSKSRSHLKDAREPLLINRYCSTLNRPPQPLLCEGIPALLRRGMAWLSSTVLVIDPSTNLQPIEGPPARASARVRPPCCLRIL